MTNDEKVAAVGYAVLFGLIVYGSAILWLW